MSELKIAEELFRNLKTEVDSAATELAAKIYTQISADAEFSKADVVVMPHLTVHQESPPYYIPDILYDSMSMKEVRALQRRPIVLLFELRINQQHVCVLWHTPIEIDTFTAKAVIKDVAKHLKNPKSFIWLRVAWHLYDHFGFEQIDDDGALIDDADDADPDWWKRGKKPNV